MKGVLKSCIVAAVAMQLLAGAMLAGTPSHKSHGKSSKSAKPVTYACKHCNIKMTVKKPADSKKLCWVCKCKKPASACRPTKAK